MAIGKLVNVQPPSSPMRGYPPTPQSSLNFSTKVITGSVIVQEVVSKFNDFAASTAVIIVSSSVQVLTGTFSGSYGQNVNTWNYYDFSVLIKQESSGTMSGSLLGNINTQGFYNIPKDNISDVPIGLDNPESLQSAQTVDWNFFPAITIIEQEQLQGTQRDLTRFKKTFGTSRQQPRRFISFKTK